MTIQHCSMIERRKKLGGFLPSRHQEDPQLPMPADKPFDALAKGSGNQEVATTMALVRLFKDLIKDKNIVKHIVPIIPDEARTFGLDAVFPTAKIFNTHGQNYTAVDAEMMLSYKESQQGQILHTGINEAGSAAAMQVVGSFYATHNLPMIVLHLLLDVRLPAHGRPVLGSWRPVTRGFAIGATAGKTTLTGEGLQHMDGHSPILAGTNPAMVTTRLRIRDSPHRPRRYRAHVRPERVRS